MLNSIVLGCSSFHKVAKQINKTVVSCLKQKLICKVKTAINYIENFYRELHGGAGHGPWPARRPGFLPETGADYSFSTCHPQKKLRCVSTPASKHGLTLTVPRCSREGPLHARHGRCFLGDRERRRPPSGLSSLSLFLYADRLDLLRALPVRKEA